MNFQKPNRLPLLGFVALAILTTFRLTPSWSQVLPPASSQPEATLSYYGVYLGKGKLGSATIKRDEHAVRDGKPAVRTEMVMRMTIKVEGATSGDITTTDVSWSDPKTGAPLAAENTTESSGRVTTISTVYGPTSVTYTASVQGASKTGTLTLKPGDHFLTDPTDGVGVKPQVGMKFKGEIFVPDLFQLVDAEVSVVGKETVQIAGLAVSAFKIIDKNPMETSTLFASDNGEILRIDNSVAGIPMQILKESKEIALAPSTGGVAPDISALTNIHPTGESLDAKARTAGAITYQITGITHDFAPTDTVQGVTYSKQTPDSKATDRIATVTVHAAALPTGPSVPLFGKPTDAPEKLRPYLESNIYVPATDPIFQNLAKSVLNGETDCAGAARKIAAYVHETVKVDPSIAALRTAMDIQKDPRGVCRDYTTLFTAIARAAGLPTKQCVGVGYVGGIFGYHAWPEVWVGKDASTGTDHWVALEPTWGMPFADATHIKLVEGEISDIFSVSSDMGHYKIKVVNVD